MTRPTAQLTLPLFFPSRCGHGFSLHQRLVSCGRENIRFWRIKKRHLPGCPVESRVPDVARRASFLDLCFEHYSPSRASDVPVLVFVAASSGCLLQARPLVCITCVAFALGVSACSCSFSKGFPPSVFIIISFPFA